MRRYWTSPDVKNEEAGTRSSLIDGTNEGSLDLLLILEGNLGIFAVVRDTAVVGHVSRVSHGVLKTTRGRERL